MKLIFTIIIVLSSALLASCSDLKEDSSNSIKFYRDGGEINIIEIRKGSSIENVNVISYGIFFKSDQINYTVEFDGELVESTSELMLEGHRKSQMLSLVPRDHVTGNFELVVIATNEYGETVSSRPLVISIADVPDEIEDSVSPILSEIEPIGEVKTFTPQYSFTSSEDSTLQVGGACDSDSTVVYEGNNTVVLSKLSVGIYSDCFLIATDASNNKSDPLQITAFTILDFTPPIVKNISTVGPSTTHNPFFSFESDESGSLRVLGECSSGTSVVKKGANLIELNRLDNGDYSNCRFIVTDEFGNSTDEIGLASFSIAVAEPIEFKAWVGNAGADIYFSNDLWGQELISSRDRNCDWTDIAQCVLGGVTPIVGEVTSEAAFTLQHEAYYMLSKSNQVEAKTKVSTDLFSPRTAHQVVEFNGKLWMSAGKSYPIYSNSTVEHAWNNDVWSSADGDVWTQETESAAFEARRDHQMYVFQEKMWILGGNVFIPNTAVNQLNSKNSNDIWFTVDGVSWQKVNTEMPFTERVGHQVVIFNEKLWLIGGYSSMFRGADPVSDVVWSSEDGITWTLIEADLPSITEHQTIVHNNKLWTIGENKIWSSVDGVNWIEHEVNGLPVRKEGFKVASLKGKLFLVGEESGSSYNHVWSSTNGTDWTFEAAAKNISPVLDPQLLSFKDNLILVGGEFTFSSSSLSDQVWSSADGRTWTKKGVDVDFSHRFSPNFIAYKGAFWLIGGFVGPWGRVPETWRSYDGLKWELVSDNLPFTSLTYEILESDGKLWLVTPSKYSNKDQAWTNITVWTSENAIDWQEETVVSDGAVKASEGFVKFKDKFWLIGGWSGVWSSKDGVTWVEELAEPPFESRQHHRVVVFDEKLWLIAGKKNTTGGHSTDVWSSEDGINWTLATANAGFSRRAQHAVTVYNERIWVVGGEAYGNSWGLDDVWSSANGRDWIRHLDNAPFQGQSSHSILPLNDRMLMIGSGPYHYHPRSSVWSSVDGYNWKKGYKHLFYPMTEKME
ncbi:MAG: hypothetical protein HRU20_25785 [Pseudomonadales bacterium]|nr:hypothetical protein [Pseudomonadales bacterium]